LFVVNIQCDHCVMTVTIKTFLVNIKNEILVMTWPTYELEYNLNLNLNDVD